MVNLDDAIVARLETYGETFEILLDPAAMDKIKAGKEIDLIEYLAVEDVFNNARKGTRPTQWVACRRAVWGLMGLAGRGLPGSLSGGP